MSPRFDVGGGGTAVTQTAWLWLVVGVLAAALGAAWLLLVQLLKQNGRLLLRLDDLESVVAGAAEELPEALPAGTSFPEFRLPDLDGRERGLDEWRGKKTLLVHWGAQCGYCDVIAPSLVRLQPALRRAGTEILLVSWGDAEDNRAMLSEHGLTCTVLLQSPGHEVGPFDTLGTPVAYLLDEGGHVAGPLALGADDVVELARTAAQARKPLPSERPLHESRIERDGLARGTPAPGFTLPTLDGGSLSLADYRGRRVLLVFSDPGCGPCDELLPELVALHERLDERESALLLVGRGDLEANREKRERYGIEFPVVLQHRWRLSRDYGIFATPVAFLIGRDGVIAADVAQGQNEILALAGELLEPRKEAPSELSVG
jgi:peroxiredoxin